MSPSEASDDDDRRRRKQQRLVKKLREIEVLIHSADGLKNVKHVTKMRTYAVVYVVRDLHMAKTHVDQHGGTDPTWNEVVKVKFQEGLPETDVMAALNFDIYAHGHVREKPVGSARVLLCDVLKGGDASEPLDNPIQCLTVQVWRPSGRPHGFLHLWVPPTGRFLIRRESLSFSVRERSEEASATTEIVVEEMKEEQGQGEAAVNGGVSGGAEAEKEVE